MVQTPDRSILYLVVLGYEFLHSILAVDRKCSINWLVTDGGILFAYYGEQEDAYYREWTQVLDTVPSGVTPGSVCKIMHEMNNWSLEVL